jgi:hypothetical protein
MAGASSFRGIAVLLLAAACLAPTAQGVIFYSTADPSYNTSAPTGSLAGSGWQWTGIWGGYEGTPIAPNYFLTARHVGGSVGDPFVFGGVTYTTTAIYDDTTTDLRICQVSGTFPTWAPIYRSSGEVGQGLVVIGEGLSRGDPVQVNAVTQGWMWGSDSGVMRWGQNTFAAVINGGSYWGDLLQAPFVAGAGPNECHLADGDSSSPVFMNDGSGWTLAGIAAAVDGPFNTTDTGLGFNAALFDARGLYYMPGSSWVLITGSEPVPSSFYATRVSERAAWIDSVVAPPSDTPVLPDEGRIALAVAIVAIGAVSILYPPMRGEARPWSS